jgi:dTDP-4-dehydrorhamnose reductase
MKALIVGCNGQLGQALKETVPDSVNYVGVDLPDLDITDLDAIREFMAQTAPGVIVNAAAYTAVDQAESERDKAAAVNVDGPSNLAQAAAELKARLIHISTDFVFDGESSIPYTADDPPNPLSVYGRTKRDGELGVLEALPNSALVIRTAWLYSKTGSNFVKTMLRLMNERDELRVVSDQVGTPTWAVSLARAVWGFVQAPDLAGIYHWTDDGVASWHEFASVIQEEALSLGLLNRAIPIKAITAADYPAAAKRPRYSVLDTASAVAALRLQPAHWRINLRSMLKGVTS